MRLNSLFFHIPSDAITSESFFVQVSLSSVLRLTKNRNLRLAKKEKHAQVLSVLSPTSGYYV